MMIACPVKAKRTQTVKLSGACPVKAKMTQTVKLSGESQVRESKNVISRDCPSEKVGKKVFQEH